MPVTNEFKGKSRETLQKEIEKLRLENSRLKKAAKGDVLSDEANSLANVVRQTTDSIVLTDLQGNITYVNPTFEKITGYTFAEVKGENPRFLRSKNADYPRGYYDQLWKTITGGNIWKGEFINKKKNGEDYIEEVSIFPVRDQQGGETLCYGAVKKDITRDRELKEELKKSYEEVVSLKEKAEAANRLKSQFLANMSHDIRTPLTGIMGFADLLFKRERRAGQKEHLQKIKVSGEGLLNLINDILDFSKIEAGQLDIYKRTFVLEDLIETIRSIFEIQFEQKNIDFEIKIAENVPTMVCNDKWRINQVINNLLSNALKFTNEGKVSIDVGCEEPGDMIVFKIKDTGIGIPKKNLKQIFDPFSQMHPPDEFKKGGTGLGLPICKNLTLLMGGRLTVRTKPVVGSEFTIEIPVNKEQVEREAVSDDLEMAPAVDIESMTHNKILIAEDNPVTRELMVEQFKDAGFGAIVLAANGKEAVQAALDHAPDLILMDIQMPVMDGNKAIAELKQKGYKGAIIAISAYAMRENIDKSLETGAMGFITKPIDFDKFFSQIGRFLKTKNGKEARGKSKKKVKTGSITFEKKSLEEYEYVIKDTVSEKIKNIFMADAQNKLEIIVGIFENNEFANKKEEVKRIAHGYKGNARYLGLSGLEAAARELDRAFTDNEPGQTSIKLSKKLASVLKRILQENRK